MPVQSSFNSDEKAKIKTHISSSSYKIQTAAFARIYFAYPDPHKWSYGGLQGAVVFVKDTARDTYFFKMVDVSGTQGVLWEHELWQNFEYFQDRPQFHSFAGDVRMSICQIHGQSD